MLQAEDVVCWGKVKPTGRRGIHRESSRLHRAQALLQPQLLHSVELAHLVEPRILLLLDLLRVRLAARLVLLHDGSSLAYQPPLLLQLLFARALLPLQRLVRFALRVLSLGTYTAPLRDPLNAVVDLLLLLLDPDPVTFQVVHRPRLDELVGQIVCQCRLRLDVHCTHLLRQVLEPLLQRLAILQQSLSSAQFEVDVSYLAVSLKLFLSPGSDQSRFGLVQL